MSLVTRFALTAALLASTVGSSVVVAWKVWWPNGADASPFAGGFDGFSAVLTALAALLLVRNVAGIIPVIAACAIIGVTRALLGF